MELGAKGPVFDWDAIFQLLRNGRCAQTVGPGSKIFSSEKPPYWEVLKPLSNQNSADDIYELLSKFSQSYTLKWVLDFCKNRWNVPLLCIWPSTTEMSSQIGATLLLIGEINKSFLHLIELFGLFWKPCSLFYGSHVAKLE